MAPKRDEMLPSRAAPSEEEESSSESIATEEEEEEEEEDPEEEEESESESESEPEKTQPQIQEQPKKQPLSQPKPAPPPSSTQDPSSESESESGSGSETESEPETPPKPNLETPNSKKPKPEQLTPSKTPSLKRPSESEDLRKPDGKKKKSSHEGLGSEDTGGPASEKKPVFQRLWSDEDEIALLKGMIDFAEKKGVDPSTRTAEFYEFVKKNIKMGASQAQLANKIRTFKNKFKNNQVKGMNGQDKVSKNPHDQKALELMRKLWSADKGIVPAEEGSKMNGAKKNNKSKSECVVPNEENMVSPKKDKDVVEKSSNSLPKKVGSAMEESMCVIEMSRLFPQSVDKLFLKGLERIGEKIRAELEERWMKLRVAEMKIADERAVLFHDQSRLIIDALNHETD